MHRISSSKKKPILMFIILNTFMISFFALLMAKIKHLDLPKWACSIPHDSALSEQSTSDAHNFSGSSRIVLQCSTKLFLCWKPMKIPKDEVVWLRFEIFLLKRCEKCRFPILKSSKSQTKFSSSVAWVNLDQMGSNFRGCFCGHRTTKFRLST